MTDLRVWLVIGVKAGVKPAVARCEASRVGHNRSILERRGYAVRVESLKRWAAVRELAREVMA